MFRLRYWRWVALVLVLSGLLSLWHARQRGSTTAPGQPAGSVSRAVTGAQVRAFHALEAREREADRTVWGPELEAQRCEDVFVTLWDTLNHAPDPWATLAEFAFGDLQIGASNSVQDLQHGIRRTRFEDVPTGAVPRRLTSAEWRTAVEAWRAQGWRLGRTSWRETHFRPATAGRAAESVIAGSAQLIHEGSGTRGILRGELVVEWRTAFEPTAPPAPRVITTRHMEWLARTGPPPFTEVLTADLTPAPNSHFVDPLLVGDLDGDGRSEIVLVGANRIFRNEGGTFRAEPLAALPAGRVLAALLVDLTGDGHPDLLVAGEDGLTLFENDGRGRFPGAGRRVWHAPTKLRHPQVITAGDIDGDGRLDVWLAQYKLPYQGGQFPTPYFDANDGFPAYLLRNDGAGRFTDITETSGLAAKRWRRTYSASFVDLDGDGHLDLVNVSDFAGVDLFTNDGHGHFRDISDRLEDTRHLFGMSHALADWNGDGRVDLLVMGMDAPTATRLDVLRLARPGFPQYTAHRAAMTYGNRLFLGSPGGLQLAPFADQVAHAGWSWSVSVFDFDNDGDLDVAVANGHETRASVKDYERQFWLHDVYVSSSSNDAVAELYFGAAAARRLREQASYGGWQDNVLFLNSGDGTFTDVAFLLGLAVPEDSQNLVSDDLDGDGRLDLVLTTFGAWPQRPERLRVFHNATPEAGNWIGFRLDSAARPWAGARVRVETARGAQTRWLVTGDSFRSQHAPAAHFGLGGLPGVTRAEVLWADGTRTTLAAPQINQWHAVKR